jgi:hypothetical protein
MAAFIQSVELRALSESWFVIYINILDQPECEETYVHQTKGNHDCSCYRK